MLAWRSLLSSVHGVNEEEINILSYVDLFESRQTDLAYLEHHHTS